MEKGEVSPITRLPTESRAARGVDGPAYELNPICAVPGCLQQSTDPHHLWRRSELIGAHWWVELPDDDAIVGNVIGLCHNHHYQVTINAAWIKWNGRGFDWSDMFTASRPLDWQPPVRPLDTEPSPEPQEAPGSPEQVSALVELGPPLSEAPVSHRLPFTDGSCPTCLRPLPHPKEHSEAKRTRRTWSLTVPVDEREDGADTLDTLLEEGRKELARAGLPYGSEDTAKFFVASTILALFVQHAEAVLADG